MIGLSTLPVMTRSTSPVIVAISLASMPSWQLSTLSTKALSLNPFTWTSWIEGTFRYVCRRVWTPKAEAPVFLTFKLHRRCSSDKLTVYSSLNLWGQRARVASVSDNPKVTLIDSLLMWLDSKYQLDVLANPCCGISFRHWPNWGNTTGMPTSGEIEWHETKFGDFNRYVYLVNLRPVLTSSDRFDAVKDCAGTNEDIFGTSFVCPTCDCCTEQVDVSWCLRYARMNSHKRQPILPLDIGNEPHTTELRTVTSNSSHKCFCEKLSRDLIDFGDWICWYFWSISASHFDFIEVDFKRRTNFIFIHYTVHTVNISVFISPTVLGGWVRAVVVREIINSMSTVEGGGELRVEASKGKQQARTASTFCFVALLPISRWRYWTASKAVTSELVTAVYTPTLQKSDQRKKTLSCYYEKARFSTIHSSSSMVVDFSTSFFLSKVYHFYIIRW